MRVFFIKMKAAYLLSPSFISRGRMGASKAALILMKISHFDMTQQYILVNYFVFSEWRKVKSWKSHEAQYFESYINCRILETTLLQVCSTNPNPNMPLQTYAIVCNLYPRRYIAPVCLKQLTWWWLSEMHQLSEMNAYRFFA